MESTATPDMYAKLCEPFPPDVLDWMARSFGSKPEDGKVTKARLITFVTARAIQDRLDAVCGFDGWRDEYVPAPAGGVLCRLSVRLPSGEWITKEGIAANTDIEPEKGGESGSLKRAAVKYGIGRYLYDLGDTWGRCLARGKSLIVLERPPLPVWALPSGHQAENSYVPVDRYLYKRHIGEAQTQTQTQAQKPALAAAPVPAPALAKADAQPQPAPTSATAGSKPTPEAMTEKAKAYVIPAGKDIPFEGQTLGSALTQSPVLGKKVLEILAGKANGASFKPTSDDDKKLVLAAAHLLEHSVN